MPRTVSEWILYFFLYSFIGWLMETVLCSVRERRFINRGFLNGPLCPIYGCGVLLILYFLLPVRDAVSNPAVALPVVFAAGAVLASAVEFITSWLMEKLFHARWWDYSSHRYNLGGRICLSISLAWGILATVIVYILHPLFEKLVGRIAMWNEKLPFYLAAGGVVLFLIDCVLSVRIARTLGNKLDQIEELGKLIKAHAEGLGLPSPEDLEFKLAAAYDAFESRKKRIASRLHRENWRALSREEAVGRLRRAIDELQARRDALLLSVKAGHKRLIRAFPTMKREGDNSPLEELKNRLRRRKR